MKWTERIMYILIISTLVVASCSLVPPTKKFTTKKFLFSGDEPCLDFLKNGEVDTVCYGETGYPVNPIVIDLGDLSHQTELGGMVWELDYQAELIKSCQAWR